MKIPNQFVPTLVYYTYQLVGILIKIFKKLRRTTRKRSPRAKKRSRVWLPHNRNSRSLTPKNSRLKPPCNKPSPFGAT